jgi:hypothetical protein
VQAERPVEGDEMDFGRISAGDRSEIRASALTRAIPAISQRSTPGDPSEMRENAPPGALSRTSQRSRPGRIHVCMIMSTPWVFNLSPRPMTSI